MFSVCAKCGNAMIASEPCPTCGEGAVRPKRAVAVARPVSSRDAEPQPADGPLDIEAMVEEINATVAAESPGPSLRDHAKSFIGVGGLILALAAAWAVQNLMFLRNAQTVTGIAVRKADTFWANGRTRTYCVVRYHADGQTLETTVNHRYVGEEVVLLVSPSDPTNVCDSSAGGLWGWPIFLAVIGGALLLTGITQLRPQHRFTTY